ncbi:hypothetical protein [Oceanobacillus halotolerans]|uniref:hypothetical protein n=1 Tax=Oceanobacillus halotolerans TaxID=2663380 RepID=UPI0013DC6FD6|nr:hypothetical protein [Oceanobacillus halotolerans]
MKKVVIGLFVVFIVLVSAEIFEGGEKEQDPSPELTLETYWEQFQNKQFEEQYDLFSEDLQAKISQEEYVNLAESKWYEYDEDYNENDGVWLDDIGALTGTIRFHDTTGEYRWIRFEVIETEEEYLIDNFEFDY